LVVDLEKTHGAAIKIKMKDGRDLFTSVDVPRADPIHSPLSDEEIKGKFWENVAFSKTISEEKAEKALVLLDKLEKIDNVTDVISLLVA
jgi:hypothetical protein